MEGFGPIIKTNVNYLVYQVIDNNFKVQNIFDLFLELKKLLFKYYLFSKHEFWKKKSAINIIFIFVIVIYRFFDLKFEVSNFKRKMFKLHKEYY